MAGQYQARAGQKRREFIAVRVSAEDKATLQAIARSRGMSVSHLLLRTALAPHMRKGIVVPLPGQTTIDSQLRDLVRSDRPDVASEATVGASERAAELQQAAAHGDTESTGDGSEIAVLQRRTCAAGSASADTTGGALSEHHSDDSGCDERTTGAPGRGVGETSEATLLATADDGLEPPTDEPSGVLPPSVKRRRNVSEPMPGQLSVFGSVGA